MPLLFVAGLAACAEPRTATAPRGAPPVARVFDYVAVDGSHFASANTRGRVTVVVFITTYDLASQIAVQELATLVRGHRPRINAGAIVLEPPRNAPLVEGFATSLDLPFPVALADAAALDARGPFGAVRTVPVVIVLDGGGVLTWQKNGVATGQELRSAIGRAVR